MLWSVFAIKDGSTVYLGQVRAKSHPGAVSRAVARWPDRVDWQRPQAGFGVQKASKSARERDAAAAQEALAEIRNTSTADADGRG